jgi:CheY-like chemotaxis protein
VAEDHETNQKVLSMILEPLGIELFICDNGAVALEAFKSQAFDLVLMDMQMPVMDGLAATTAIRDFERETKAQSTPIIMLTANAMSQHRLAAKQAGADWHVAKPFTPTTLIAAIKMGLELKDQEMEDRVSAQAEV